MEQGAFISVSLKELEKIMVNAVDKSIDRKFREIEKHRKSLDGKMLSPKEAANYLGLSVQTIYNYMEQGILKGEKIGNSTRIHEREIHKALRSMYEDKITKGIKSIEQKTDNPSNNYKSAVNPSNSDFWNS